MNATDEEVELARSAISYALRRIADDPDVGYYCGDYTEMFVRLCAAHAVATGQKPNDVRDQVLRRQRAWTRKPEILELREAAKAL